MENEPGCVSAVTENALPVRRWQRLQWQNAAPTSGAATSNETAPHMQLPVMGTVCSGTRFFLSGGLLDELDAVAVRIADEADPERRVGVDLVRRLLRVDALLGEVRELAVEVVDGHRDVVVARPQLVAVDAVVVGQLEARAVAREAHEDVHRLVADVHPADLFEAERGVEGDGPVDVADA